MKKGEYLDSISEIKNIMERSTRFLSLSGLSGVFAGSFALLGAVAAYLYLDFSNFDAYAPNKLLLNGHLNYEFINFLLLNAGSVLFLSVAAALFFTIRKSKKQGLELWTKSSFEMLLHLAVPLLSGGITCLILIFKYQFVGVVGDLTLIFYGLALFSASRFTLKEIRYLGMLEILLGLISLFFPGYGIFFWALGFGVLHIFYGLLMYRRYEAK